MSKKQLYYSFTAKIVRLQHFRIVCWWKTVSAQRTYFFVYCGAKLRPGTRQKGLDFRPWSSYYTTAIRDRNRPAAERSWAIVLYHINTTDRFGTHGNSGHKSDEKCHNLCKMHQKALESAIKNIIQGFGNRSDKIRQFPPQFRYSFLVLRCFLPPTFLQDNIYHR